MERVPRSFVSIGLCSSDFLKWSKQAKVQCILRRELLHLNLVKKSLKRTKKKRKENKIKIAGSAMISNFHHLSYQFPVRALRRKSVSSTRFIMISLWSFSTIVIKVIGLGLIMLIPWLSIFPTNAGPTLYQQLSGSWEADQCWWFGVPFRDMCGDLLVCDYHSLDTLSRWLAFKLRARGPLKGQIFVARSASDNGSFARTQHVSQGHQ